MSYYLYRIQNHIEHLSDMGLKRFSHNDIIEIKNDIVKMKSNNLCMVQFYNDVKKEVGMSVPKTHNQFYYISDYADTFRLRYLKRFVRELKEYLLKINSEILKNVVNTLIETYSSNEWLLTYHFTDYEKEVLE